MRPLLVCLGLLAVACSTPPTATSNDPSQQKPVEVCNNGKDDDGDGDVDCLDADCADRCPICGDGLIQEPETCEGLDLQGVTCATLGYAPEGRPVCNRECEVETGSCAYPQRDDCSKPGDEDHDGVADCEDSDCAGVEGSDGTHHAPEQMGPRSIAPVPKSGTQDFFSRPP